MKKLTVHPDARTELLHAIAYYEEQQLGLGKRFLEAVKDAGSHIQLGPDRFVEVLPGVHRCLTSVFPFGLIYRETDDRIEIIAVAHTSKRPFYWEERA